MLEVEGMAAPEVVGASRSPFTSLDKGTDQCPTGRACSKPCSDAEQLGREDRS